MGVGVGVGVGSMILITKTSVCVCVCVFLPSLTPRVTSLDYHIHDRTLFLYYIFYNTTIGEGRGLFHTGEGLPVSRVGDARIPRLRPKPDAPWLLQRGPELSGSDTSE